MPPQTAPFPQRPPQVVEPKIAALHDSEAELRVATRERQAVEQELAVVQAQLDEMQAQFDAAMAQKQVGGRAGVGCGRGGWAGAVLCPGQGHAPTREALCFDGLPNRFPASPPRPQALEEDAAATQRRMDAANALISALGGEEVRWTAQSRLFDDVIDRLTGDAAIASRWGGGRGEMSRNVLQAGGP